MIVLFTDERWHPATILAWCRYQHGWAALIHWPDGREDWRRHDPRGLRRSVEHLGGWLNEHFGLLRRRARWLNCPLGRATGPGSLTPRS